MAMTHDVNTLKSQARNLRAALVRAGTPVTHSQALELVAQTHGARDWNTAHATAEDAALWQFGGPVRGRYLGQPFTGRVIAASERGRSHHALRSPLTSRSMWPGPICSRRRASGSTPPSTAPGAASAAPRTASRIWSLRPRKTVCD